MTATADDLPGPLRDALAGAVQPGEVVRWSGRPGPVRDDMTEWLSSVVGWMWVIVTVPFTIGLAYLVHLGPNRDPQASPAWTVLVCTVFVGIGLLPARMPARKRKRFANTVYAVTDRRAVVIETWWAGWWCWWRSPWVQSFWPAELGKLRRVDYPAGRGDVVLAERIVHDSEWGDRIELDAFLNVLGAREVEALVRSLLDQPQPAAVEHPYE